MDGSDYDGDNPKELIDDTSSSYDSTNKKHVGSATTKSIIKAFSTKYLEVKALVETNTEDSLAQAKTKFAEYFDVNACMLLYIFNCLMRNIDSIRKNTLWAVYKNGKIAPMLWDLDAMYGQHWIGNSADAPSAELWEGSYATSEWPLKLFWTLYKSEVKTSYANLRKDGIININTWHSIMFDEWVNRIGTEAYERDIEKWSETPSYRKNYTDTAYWKEEYYTDSVGSISAWNSETDYSKGDKVYIKLYDTVSQYMIYTAVQASTGICPVTKYYEGFPIVGGFYDSPKRMEKWMDEQINLCDKEMEYTTSN